MKKWIWLGLVALVAVVIIGIGVFFHPTQETPVVATTRVETPQRKPQSKQVTNSPQVSADKLFAHIQKLNFKRFTDVERSRSRSYITSELKKLGWKPTLEKFSSGVNIFAERQGTDKAAGAILVAAHYDTVAISPGADDNASGVAVVLEVARVLGSRPTPRTLQLALFDKEEEGLLGSKAFVANKTRLANLRGVIVMDMVVMLAIRLDVSSIHRVYLLVHPATKAIFWQRSVMQNTCLCLMPFKTHQAKICQQC